MISAQVEVAVITGGASGLGAAVARKLASRKVNILIADLQEELANTLIAELESTFGVEARFKRTDVSVESDVQQMVAAAIEAWGRLDYGVNCAGICEKIWDEEETMSVGIVDRTFAINQRGIWLCQKYEAQQMKRQEPRAVTFSPPSKFPVRPQRGAIVNVASLASHFGMGLAAYTPTKHAILGITRNGAKFYGPYGIRCNAISPGHTMTPMLEVSLGEAGKAGSEASTTHEALNRIPLGTMAHPEEQANVISFLLSPESSYIHGSILVIDGGMHSTM